ncbi:amidohydrolase family protein [uncultured Rhodoblastus sp.]|uniref:amidohydrolase family protein n=1 Tax=uncultured Rhodoblastus sp. TaxID=543037 RepID=UPI0025FE607C|nr:amidohydrolase family protein [uncultured Rhodoblastus sp.]
MTSLSEPYDLVINNGRVMDPETGLDAVRNVGVKDGKIAAITGLVIRGAETIDATGHVVAPGFIDGHCHGANDAFAVKCGVRDGKTTQLDLELGAWPVDAWYKRWEGQAQANYGAVVGHLAIRDDVFSGIVANTGNLFLEAWKSKGQWSVRKASPEDLKAILGKIEQGLKQGALGVGTPVGYATSGLTAFELNQAWRLAGEHGLFATVHGRFSSMALPTEGILGTLEAIASATMFGAGLLVHHFHAQVLSAVEDVAGMVDQARARGVKVLLEMYPYTYGSSVMMADYLHPDNYNNDMGHSYGDITLVQTMQPMTKETYELALKETPMATILFNHCTEPEMVKAMAWPSVCLGSDGVPYMDDKASRDAEGATTVPYDFPDGQALGHPRGAGTYAKVFRYVREQKVTPLMTAVAKSSYLLARFMEDCGVPQMAFKGRIQVGADADITIFDPQTITDNATREHGALPSSGIPFVIVNGVAVVKNSTVVEGVYPGKPIRRPVTQI